MNKILSYVMFYGLICPILFVVHLTKRIFYLDGRKFLMGTLSAICVLGVYSYLSHRQHQLNPNDRTIPNFRQFQQGFTKIVSREICPDCLHYNNAGKFRCENCDANLVSLFDSILWRDLVASAKRFGLATILSVTFSVTLGIMMGFWPIVDEFFGPPVKFLASIPPTAMLAIYFVIFGTDIQMFTAMIGIGIAPSMMLIISNSVSKDVDETSRYKAITLGASTMEVICGPVFLQVLPRILLAIQNAMPAAAIFLVASEYNVGDIGFGFRLRIMSRLQGMNVVYLYLFILGGLGLLIDFLLIRLRRRLCPWFGE